MSKLKNKILYSLKLMGVLVISFVILFSGCVVAAYNTEMLGFNGENQIIYENKEEIFVLGIEIRRKDIEKAKEIAKKFIKDGITNTYNI